MEYEMIEPQRNSRETAKPEMSIQRVQVDFPRIYEFLASPVESFPGNGNEPETLKELARLKRENERLAGELDILKKAISIFSKGPR